MTRDKVNFHVRSHAFILIQQIFAECLPDVPVTALSLQELIPSNESKPTLLMVLTFW